MAMPASAGLLQRQLKQMQTDMFIPGVSCGLTGDSVYEWEIMLMISDECKDYGGTNILTPPSNPSTPSLNPKAKSPCLPPSRRLLPRLPHLPPRIPAPTTDHEIPDAHLPPEHLPQRHGLHQHPSPSARRRVRLRVGRRALEPRPDPRDYPTQRHLHA